MVCSYRLTFVEEVGGGPEVSDSQSDDGALCLFQQSDHLVMCACLHVDPIDLTHRAKHHLSRHLYYDDNNDNEDEDDGCRLVECSVPM